MADQLQQLSSTAQKSFIATTKPLKKVFDDVVEPVFKQPIIQLIVTWFVIVSIVFSITDLPIEVVDFIKHPIVKTILIFSSSYVYTDNFYISLGFTLALLLLNYALSMFNTQEGFKIIWPETDTYLGCKNVTVKDLLELFDGDSAKLKKTMYESGVPLDLKLNDRNAPLIATYLINFGHKISDTCSAPM